MHVTEWKWQTQDALELYAKAWTPDSPARGLVCLVHGLGEHIGRYQADAAALTEAGYILAGFDQRGFGQSAGRRGHTPSLDAYFDDIGHFLAATRQRYPGLPTFLYGHSMGGILVLAYTPLRRPPVVGVIATSPGLKSSIEAQKAKVLLVKLLGSAWPTLTLHSEIDAQLLSRDPRVAEEYVNDPLVHTSVTAGWGKAMLQAVALAYQQAPNFPAPLLLMHGADDQIAYPEGSRLYAGLVPKEKLTFQEWAGFKHELHTDSEKAAVFAAMTTWLNEHVVL
ncbi:MAG TPA: lysophospholipase [Chloroflexi bacterium]|nr:lysophospholipase [Chloroflexota bacterium]HHW86032.1 alpha/beta hydrolase [Chloroflexota bacterium]